MPAPISSTPLVSAIILLVMIWSQLSSREV